MSFQLKSARSWEGAIELHLCDMRAIRETLAKSQKKKEFLRKKLGPTHRGYLRAKYYCAEVEKILERAEEELKKLEYNFLHGVKYSTE